MSTFLFWFGLINICFGNPIGVAFIVIAYMWELAKS